MEKPSAKSTSIDSVIQSLCLKPARLVDLYENDDPLLPTFESLQESCKRKNQQQQPAATISSASPMPIPIAKPVVSKNSLESTVSSAAAAKRKRPVDGKPPMAPSIPETATAEPPQRKIEPNSNNKKPPRTTPGRKRKTSDDESSITPVASSCSNKKTRTAV